MKSLLITFPGQGSQFVGMGQKFFDSPYRDIATKYFNTASEILGFDTKALCFQGPAQELTLTQNTQPLILTVSSIYGEIIKKSLEKHKLNFITMGHSVGEYSALVFAGALSFTDAIKLTRSRGVAMQESFKGNDPSMVAILKATTSLIEKSCEEAQEEINQSVSIANYNSPSQVVISGTQKACELAIEKLKIKEEKSFRSVKLNVSAPFHCLLMKDAKESMRSVISQCDFNQLEMDYVPNVSAEVFSTNKSLSEIQEKIAHNLTEQITAPVLWTQSIRAIEKNIFACIDCGPGDVTAGLLKRTNKEIPLLKLGSQKADEIEQLTQSFINEIKPSK